MSGVAEIIAEEIGRHGAIPFARFMELALYCPVYGYYEKEEDNIGRRGDYYTSVSVGSLFGELLAFQFAEWLGAGELGSKGVQILEAGAHRGDLARDTLDWMQRRRPELFERLEYLDQRALRAAAALAGANTGWVQRQGALDWCAGGTGGSAFHPG